MAALARWVILSRNSPLDSVSIRGPACGQIREFQPDLTAHFGVITLELISDF